MRDDDDETEDEDEEVTGSPVRAGRGSSSRRDLAERDSCRLRREKRLTGIGYYREPTNKGIGSLAHRARQYRSTEARRVSR